MDSGAGSLGPYVSHSIAWSDLLNLSLHWFPPVEKDYYPAGPQRTPFHSRSFYYNVNEIIQELHSCLYQFTYGEIVSSPYVSFHLKSHILLMTLSEDLPYYLPHRVVVKIDCISTFKTTECLARNKFMAITIIFIP